MLCPMRMLGVVRTLARLEKFKALQFRLEDVRTGRYVTVLAYTATRVQVLRRPPVAVHVALSRAD